MDPREQELLSNLQKMNRNRGIGSNPVEIDIQKRWIDSRVEEILKEAEEKGFEDVKNFIKEWDAAIESGYQEMIAKELSFDSIISKMAELTFQLKPENVNRLAFLYHIPSAQIKSDLNNEMEEMRTQIEAICKGTGEGNGDAYSDFEIQNAIDREMRK